MADPTNKTERNISQNPLPPDFPKRPESSTPPETNQPKPDLEVAEHKQARQEMITHEKEVLKKKEEGFLDETISGLKEKLRKKKKAPKSIPQLRDEMTIKIEHVMQEGLNDAYRELTPVQQQEFKIKGEKTALEIRQLLKRGHVKMKTIFKLLVEWLKLLPGVNRFFIEQEAKIKADKIVGFK